MRLIDADALLQMIDYHFPAQNDNRFAHVYDTVVFIRSIINGEKTVEPGITNEDAIDQLRRTGWLQEHDRDMASGDLAGIINRIMEGHDKSISVSIYPWEEEKECLK